MAEEHKEAEKQKHKKQTFVEKWGRAEEVNSYLGLTLYAVIGFALITLFVAFRLATKPQPIYYIPGAREAGIAFPNRIEKGSISGFAVSWLLNRTNFTPATAEDVYQRATKYLSPALLSRTRAELDDEIKRIRRDDISSLFSLSKDAESEETETGYKVIVNGEKSLFMGKEKLDSQMLRYSISLERVPPTEINPYGLLITGVRQDKISE